MHPLEKKTLGIIRREGLLLAGEKVVIGVSAGPDSMALLYVLARLAPLLDITPAAAYVNHGLRPQAAVKEKNLVEAAAAHLALDFFATSVDVRGLAQKQKFSIEQSARLLRYDFLEKIAHTWGAQKIALAHSADDQAEEILLRLIRGTARKGLSGMKTLRDGRFIRPFLRFPKSDLLDYLGRNSIPFRLDESNAQDHYLRNRIRHDLLPYLAKRYNPEIRQTLVRTANILQDEEELLARSTEAAFAESVTYALEARTENGNIQPDILPPQKMQLNLKIFAGQPRPIQRRLLEKCCWLMACNPSSRQIENLLQLATRTSSGTRLHLANGLRVARNKEQLCFTYPLGQGPLRGNLQAETEDGLPETTIPSPGSYDFPALNKRLVVEEIDGALPGPGDAYPTGEYIDSALFSFPLTLRSPGTGDRFRPLGAPGSKKVNNFLSEQKIDKKLRAQAPVLCVDDTIIALPGLRIDHRFRITENTTRAVRVLWEELG